MAMVIHTENPFAGLEEIVSENEPLAPHTWYKIGGPARWYVRPRLSPPDWPLLIAADPIPDLG